MGTSEDCPDDLADFYVACKAASDAVLCYLGGESGEYEFVDG